MSPPPSPQVSVLETSHLSREQEKVSLADRVSSLSSQLTLTEGQLGVANDRLLQHERSKALLESVGAERLEEIRTLTRELEELKPRAEGVSELREQVEHLEGELSKKQAEVSVEN